MRRVGHLKRGFTATRPTGCRVAPSPCSPAIGRQSIYPPTDGAGHSAPTSGAGGAAAAAAARLAAQPARRLGGARALGGRGRWV